MERNISLMSAIRPLPHGVHRPPQIHLALAYFCFLLSTFCFHSTNPLALKTAIASVLRYRTHRGLRSRLALSSPHRRSFRRTWSTVTPNNVARSFRELRFIRAPPDPRL